MSLIALSKPSGGDRKRPPRVVHQMRSKKRRKDLKDLVDKVIRHEKNAAEHRGHKDAYTMAQELTTYVRGALAIVQPYDADGNVRPEGNKEEFWTWLDKMRDLMALMLPYERPKLASITVRDERPEDRKPYMTIYELRVRMEQKGLPVDHLLERKLLLEHEYAAGTTPERGRPRRRSRAGAVDQGEQVCPRARGLLGVPQSATPQPHRELVAAIGSRQSHDVLARHVRRQAPEARAWCASATRQVRHHEGFLLLGGRQGPGRPHHLRKLRR